MLQDYVELDGQAVLRDPDELGEYTIAEIEELAACLHEKDPALYAKHRKELKQMLTERLRSAYPEAELVVVPTSSLYVEALVGTHPLLEDFKLLHRSLDVKRAQADVRHIELENVRLAARALEGEREDPDIERKIVVEGIANPDIPTD
jgi:hypothetical protein